MWRFLFLFWRDNPHSVGQGSELAWPGMPFSEGDTPRVPSGSFFVDPPLGTREGADRSNTEAGAPGHPKGTRCRKGVRGWAFFGPHRDAKGLSKYAHRQSAKKTERIGAVLLIPDCSSSYPCFVARLLFSFTLFWSFPCFFTRLSPPSRPPCPFPFEFFASHFCLFGNFTLDSPSRTALSSPGLCTLPVVPLALTPPPHLLSTFCGTQSRRPPAFRSARFPSLLPPSTTIPAGRVHPVVDLPTKSTRFASLSAPPAWLPNQTSARRMPFLAYPGGA